MMAFFRYGVQEVACHNVSTEPRTELQCTKVSIIDIGSGKIM